MGNLLISNGGVATNKEGMASIDLRYGPYASLSAAHAALSAEGLCAIGLTVGIINGNKVDEYWYQGGTSESNLVKKQSDVTVDAYTKTESDEKYQPKGNYQPAGDYATKTELNGKVDNVPGKGLSTNDYTNEEKQKVADALVPADIAGKANASDVYTKSETYTKTEVNGLVDTPHQEYVTVNAYANLPATGSKDTIYRVSNYNGSTSQVDASVYSQYAWDGSQYVFLCVKSQIGEVFDISVYNNNAKYADLADAIGTNSSNIPQNLRKGGMSVKFVQSSDNQYLQYRYKGKDATIMSVFTNPDNWQNEGAVFSDVFDATDLNSIVKPGIYRTKTPTNQYVVQILIVRSNADGLISQLQIGTYTNGNAFLRTRATEDNGTTWTDWKNCLETDLYYDGVYSSSTLDSTLSTGIYRGEQSNSSVKQTILIVRKQNSNNAHQTLIGYNDSYVFEIKFRNTTDGGSTWSDWNNIVIDKDLLFRETFNSSNINTKTTSGVYKGIGDMSSYILITRAINANNKHQMLIGLAFSGTDISIRHTTDGGETWTDWSGYDIARMAEIYMRKYQILPFILSSSNQWREGQGKLYCMPVEPSVNTKININTASAQVITFLKELPNIIANEYLDTSYFAGNYTSRVSLSANSETEFEIPQDCHVILLLAENSQGVDITPTVKISGVLSSDVYSTIRQNGLMSITETKGVDITNPNFISINAPKCIAANEADMWINPKNGMVYAVYSANDTDYYETEGRVEMAIFPLISPWNVKHIEVANTHFVPVTNDRNKPHVVVGHICPIENNTKLRIFIMKTHQEQEGEVKGYMYKDFDLATETFGEVRYLQYNGSNLTTDVINSLITEAGYEIEEDASYTSPVYGSFVTSEVMYMNQKDGYYYQLFKSRETHKGHFPIFRSNDNWTTCEFVGVFPYSIRYDAMIEYLNGTFYIIYRKGSTNGLQAGDGVYITTTTDLTDKTKYTVPVLVGTMDMRPDIFVKNDMVYLVVGDKRNQGDGFYRTNMHIYKGIGPSLNDYTKIVNVTENRGMVNPRARLFGDDIHVLVSSSPIRLDKENNYWSRDPANAQYQGKECECYLRVRLS